MAVKKAAESAKAKLLEIAGKELEIDAADLEVADGEVDREGRAAEEDLRRRRRRRGDVDARRADHRHRART